MISEMRVGVIRGGGGGEYDLSLATGGAVLKHIRDRSRSVVDILITKDGEWHAGGFPVTPAQIAGQVDVVFNALHGSFGESGNVQRTLSEFNIPHTGSLPFASAIAMHKGLAKEVFATEGLSTPRFSLVRPDDSIQEVAFRISQTLASPYIIKPATEGSSLGVSIAYTLTDLVSAIEHASAHALSILVEEYIQGREVTCGVIESADSGELYATPPLEILLPENEDLFHYDIKRRNRVPRRDFSSEYAETAYKVQEQAKRAHQALDLRHYSRSDFIVTNDKIYLLETNSLPALDDGALFPHGVTSAGLNASEFIDYVLTLALRNK